MEEPINTIVNGDCIAGMNDLPAGSVDLVFADPPFNIGYDYDVYQDKLETEKYVAWSRDWIAAVYRALKDDGAFWLAIGDEYAAELKVASQEIGFHSRSWIVWYYTFGVNCTTKFTRSHAHLFYFVKDPKKFTFRSDDLTNRIPSARQLVYNDKRANPKGRLPDDTWIIRPADAVGELTEGEEKWAASQIVTEADEDQTYTLRPQDIEQCFQKSEDTWYFPRVAGTFKERAGFHGCQMPEQLLGRIIRTCSAEDELVLDPFSGSATTLVVAKKLGRKYLGFDISQQYIRHGRDRLAAVCRGDQLDGAAEPTMSAPKTGERNRKQKQAKAAKAKRPQRAEISPTEERYEQEQLRATISGVAQAFAQEYAGHSVDRLVADPELNQRFTDRCREFGLAGDARSWNLILFRLRKAGKLAHLPTASPTVLDWESCDAYLYGSEIALQKMLDEERAESLDEILADPQLAAQFDAIAQQLAPGFSPLEYRWAALKLRKHAKTARSRGAVLAAPSKMGKIIDLDEMDLAAIPARPAVYLLRNRKAERFYAGETLDLQSRLQHQFGEDRIENWQQLSGDLCLQTFAIEKLPKQMLAWQSCLARKYQTPLNFHELSAC